MDDKHTEDQEKDLELEIDLNVLNHLGIGLYSSTPAVVTEIVANAWDADAKTVRVSIFDDHIVVHDDGHGMSRDALQQKFLRVGYARRDQGKGNKSDTLARPVMGRKGIGKLAMFSLADQIDIWSKMEGSEPIAARINVDQLRRDIKSNKSYKLEKIDIPHNWDGATGTRIVLSRLTAGTDKTESFLRPRIARRFSVLGDIHNFKVFIDDLEIKTQDRNYHSDIQFWWDLDDQTRADQKPLLKNLATDEEGHECIKRVNDTVVVGFHAYKMRGFIATVAKPKSLKKTDDNINHISLFANGRVFQEDMLKDIGNAKVFNSYIVGEIHADFLDADDIDRATANREAVKTGDPLVSAVRNWLKATLDDIADQWDEWRRQQKMDSDDDRTKLALEKWYGSLTDPRDRKLAQRLINPVLSGDHSNDENKNKEIKRDLVRSAIVGFEKLRVRKQLDRLEKITDVLSVEFQRLFANLDDIEATHYHEITRSRLQVIEKFEKEIVDTQALEKVAQAYLFDHLWLLDPTWGPVGESKTMELTLTKELLRVSPDADTGARIDIAYRTSSGRHIIVELKRPGLEAVDVYDLIKQGSKYKAAITEYLTTHPDLKVTYGKSLPIDVFFVTEKLPKTTHGDALEMMKKHDMQSFTYRGMIANARNAYHEYLSASPATSTIDDIISNIV